MHGSRLRAGGVAILPAGTTIVDLVGRLCGSTDRTAAAADLARHVGVEEVFLYVTDPVLPVMLPAPGFAQTMRGGERWRRFLAQCGSPGRHAGVIDLPRGAAPRRALALASEGFALILAGGEPVQAQLDTIDSLLRMVRGVLQAELRAMVASAQAEEARSAAGRAQMLADALEAARADAARLNAELRQEHVRKDHFLAMLGHELRNPLAPLVTSIELLRRGGEDRRTRDERLDIMTRQLGQLSRLVEDLLDVSRVSHGRIELRRERHRLRDTVAHALEAARGALEARRHAAEIVAAEGDLYVDADRIRLTQVFGNLIHNAAKYTDPGGRLVITLAREGDDAVVSLRDNGIGIEPEVLPRVFDLFAQAPISLSRSQGGLGVGLTLVRSLVKLHGGQVAAQSPGLGKGSTFTVRLPVVAPPDALTNAPQAPQPARSGRAVSVLVVDDNRDAADSLAALLRMGGHRAEVAYTGLGALHLSSDLAPDVYLIDIGLPDMDGYELARRLRRVVRREVHLAAITGYGSPEDKRRAQEAGFDEHIVKPVMPDALESLMRRAASQAIPT